jgi:predicted permease
MNRTCVEAMRLGRCVRSGGSLELTKEVVTSAGWESLVETFWQDVRYGLRMLAKNPGFTAIVVLTLALGIGMNTAIFSLVDQLLLWTVPAHEPNQLVKIEGSYSSSYPFFCAYRDLNNVFSGVLASSDNLSAAIRPAGAPGVEVGHVEYVSGGYFQILGIGSAAGRVIISSDDGAPGTSPVAVLSYRYWQRRFSGDLQVIGQKLAVNTYPLVIVGIAENGFGGLFNRDEPDAFIPVEMYPVTTPSAAASWNAPLNPWLSVVARLKSGVSLKQAQASMPVLWLQAVERVGHPGIRAVTRAHLLQKDESRLEPAARASRFIRNQRFLDPIKVLAIATALLLMLACANVANLLLARASERWKETAVRLALGGTRGRLIRQFLTESLLLAAAGSTAGMGLAYLGVRALAKLEILDTGFRFRLSLFVLTSCIGLALLTTILFGLVPALRATQMKLAESVKESGPATQGISRSRLSKLLVMSQIALSLTLLVLASLFGRTLRNLQHVDLGFARENIAIFDIDPTILSYRGQQLRTFYDQLLQRARALPGVRSAAVSAVTPLSNYIQSVSVSEGSSPGEFKLSFSTYVNQVSSGYFTTLGIPVLVGRDFRPEDERGMIPSDRNQFSRSGGGGKWVDTSTVCIMDEVLARQQFGTINSVGRRFCYPGSDCSGANGIEVVGVVKAAHYEGVTSPDHEGMLYEPSWANGAASRRLEVRFGGSAAPVIAGIRQAVQEQDPSVPLLSVRMMEDYVSSHFARERLVAYLSSFFGILALALTSVGLYGVIAYVVTQRTREIGIRLALGARRRDVVAVIFRASIVPVVAGVFIGLAASFLWSLFLGSLLFGVDSFDLRSPLLAVAVILAAALLAAAIPARRAMKVDPIVALRYE